MSADRAIDVCAKPKRKHNTASADHVIRVDFPLAMFRILNPSLHMLLARCEPAHRLVALPCPPAYPDSDETGGKPT